MQPVSRVILYACAATLIGSLAGCRLQGQQPARDTGRGRPVPVLTDVAAALITRTGSYYTDQQVLDRAESALSDRCLARQGFHQPASASPNGSARDEEWRPDPTERRRHGYGLADAASDAAPSAVDAYVQRLPPARQAQYERALFGDPARSSTILVGGKQISFPTTGCLADSRVRLYGSTADAARITFVPQQYFIELYLTVQRRPDYRTEITKWADCMRQAGHPYASPADAKRQLSTRGLTTAAASRDREITIALADAACAAQARLPATVETLLLAEARLLTPAGTEELNRAAAGRASAAGHARTLLAHTTPTPPTRAAGG